MVLIQELKLLEKTNQEETLNSISFSQCRQCVDSGDRGLATDSEGLMEASMKVNLLAYMIFHRALVSILVFL